MEQKIGISKKLNSEKGITGVDIVVAITMIVLTISVVMAIFININDTARRVTRTSGATRIATNILEQIEIMYYGEFEEYLLSLDGKAGVTYTKTKDLPDRTETFDWDGNGKYVIVGKEFVTEKLFNTRIPTGYTVTLEVFNLYGTTDSSKYNLVKEVKVNVSFPVSGRTQNVELKTTKKFEKLSSMANLPEITKSNFPVPPDDYSLLEFTYLRPVMSGAEIKYEKVAALEPIMYSYTESSNNPALMIPTTTLSGADYVTTFDGSGQFVKSSCYDEIYVWIPAYNLKSNKFVYGYKSSDKRITQQVLNQIDDTVNTVACYVVDRNTVSTDYALDPKSLGKDGLWVKASDLNLNHNKSATERNDYYYNFWDKSTCSLKN